MSVYLDHNATSPIRPEAAEAAMRALSIGGNASSVHARGRAARAVIEEARGAVAALAGMEDVVFTSGGAEANALAIHSARAGGKIARLIVGATEHPSVRDAAKASGLPVETWPVGRNGVADLGWLADRLAEGGRALVLLMAANNETGVIQPVAETARLVREAGGVLHVDAVQAVGRLSPEALAGADTLTLSAHKLGGPQGSGALAYASSAAIHRLQQGGGQERGLRGGTENLSGIAGFGAAASAARAGAVDQTGWRDAAADRLKAAGAIVVGEGAARLPNTLNVAVEGWPSALQVMSLDLAGVMVSAGSACSSGKVSASPVLDAMGLGDLAAGSLRASGGWNTTAEDWAAFADAWLAAFERHGTRVRAKEYA